MAVNSGMFSSKTDLWPTPQDFYDRLDEEFHFETDVCALPSNAKAKKFYTPKIDGLTQTWSGVCWMNPPYGKVIPLWVEKAYRSAVNGATVVCLLPSRTDTRWFQDFCLKSSDIRFVRGRLRFGDGTNSAPFPSVVVVFSPETLGLIEGGSTIMKVEEMLSKSLEAAYKSAQAITEPEKKANTYAKIALACATAMKAKGLPAVADAKEEAIQEETPVAAPPAEEKKKPTTSAKKVPEKKAEKKEEPEFTNEWTPDALEYFDSEINELQQLKDSIISDYGEEAFDSAIEQATEGQYTSGDDVSPLNIRLILSYIKEKMAEAEEMEE